MSEHEINQEEREEHRICEVAHIVRTSIKKAERIRCDRLTEYRVKRYSEKRYLEEGGDPQNAKDYKREQTEATEYVCRKHFQERYLYAETQIFEGECPSDYMRERESEYGRFMGKFSFRRMRG